MIYGQQLAQGNKNDTKRMNHGFYANEKSKQSKVCVWGGWVGPKS